MSAQSKAEFVLWMGPLLDALRELGDSAAPQEASDLIAKNCNLSDDKREELMISGVPRFQNQVCWARQYLVWEGLVCSAKRGIWTLTAEGKESFLSIEDSSTICKKWVEIHALRRKESKIDRILSEDNDGPEESSSVEPDNLLGVLQSMTPNGFEQVSVTPIGKDGGIDGYGVLQINPFESFKVIFQCKRYKNTVSRVQVGDLRNAMIGRAEKGIMITTGNFSEDAKREAARAGAPPIELVDGSQLVRMLEKEEVGVKPRMVYEVDHSFFKPYLSDS